MHSFLPRRRLQFSLGTMLLVITLVGCGLGWIARERRFAAEARAALAPFEEAGGMLHRERTAAWREWMIGDDPGRSVRYICVEGMKITDADLDRVAALKSLQRLRMAHTQISDAGLARLHGLKQLQAVHVHQTAVTAAGVAKFHAALPQCELLSSWEEEPE